MLKMPESFRGFRIGRMHELLERIGRSLRRLNVEKTQARLPLPDFDHEERQVRPPTAAELDALPKELRDSMQQLYGGDAREHGNAAWRLSVKLKNDYREELAPHMDMLVPHLIQSMQVGDVARNAVHHAVERFPDAVKPHLFRLIPRLEQDLQSPFQHTRAIATEIVHKLTSDTYKNQLMRLRPLIPALAERLNDNDSHQSIVAGRALSNISRMKPDLLHSHADAILPALSTGMSNQFADTRAGAQDALLALGPKALPELVKHMQEQEYGLGNVYRQVSRWLQEGHHPEFRDAAIGVFKAHVKPYGSMITQDTSAAIDGLVRLQDRQALPFLAAKLNEILDKPPGELRFEDNYRGDLIGTIHRMGSAAVPHLIETVKKEDDVKLKAQLAEMIGEQYQHKDDILKTHFDSAVRSLVPLLSHNAWDVKDKARKALSGIRKSWKKEMGTHHEALSFALEHLDPAVFPKAFMTLWEDRQDPDYKTMTDREWALHIKHLKSNETALKAA